MKKQMLLALILIIIVSTTTISLAIEEADYDSLSRAIKDNSDIRYLFGDSGLLNMSKSVFEVIRYLLLAVAIIRLFMLYMEFANVGDNPQIIASIKSKALWYILGIMFILNIWKIISFANNVFSKIKFS